ncbi:MAG: hypothetical protein QOE55_8585 [Acidobacteriaceae bacterium]|jgi:hypothetical protein|nr:hypothetical protein [Acidobacteriaceae bacterium]
MRSDAKKSFYFHADASSLGGFIEKPFHKHLPPQASASLPSVGGHITTRTEAFEFEGVISCRSAQTRVSGRHLDENGSASILVTSVLEGLNILEIIKAERIVAQVTAEYSGAGGFPRISFAGSHFDGLVIGHSDASIALNSGLLGFASGKAVRPALTQSFFQETGRQQAAKLVKSVKAESDHDTLHWLTNQYGWMDSDRKPEKDGFSLCSLVDGVGGSIPGRSFGHVIDIPDFGRIFLGEVLVHPRSVQISMVRAELGCSTHGKVGVGTASVRGTTVPP